MGNILTSNKEENLNQEKVEKMDVHARLAEFDANKRKKLFEETKVNAEEILEFSKVYIDRLDLTDDQLANLINAEIFKVIENKDNDKNNIKIENDNSIDSTKSIIEFAFTSYSVFNNEQICRIIIERYSELNRQVSFRIKTIDGSAKAGKDYKCLDQIYTLNINQRFIPIDIDIIDDNYWRANQTFFIKLSLDDNDDEKKNDIIIGPKSVCMVNIVDVEPSS